MNKSIVIRTTSLLLLMLSFHFIVTAQKGNTDTLYIFHTWNCNAGITLNDKYITNETPIRLILKRGKKYEVRSELLQTNYNNIPGQPTISGSTLVHRSLYLNSEVDTTFKNSNVGYMKAWGRNETLSRQEGEKLLSKISAKIQIEEYVDPDAEAPQAH